MSFGTSITELPSLVWNMIRNKVFMIVTLTSCSEFSIVVAFLTFMPKYIQDQFSIDPSKVSIFIKHLCLWSSLQIRVNLSKNFTLFRGRLKDVYKISNLKNYNICHAADFTDIFVLFGQQCPCDIEN